MQKDYLPPDYKLPDVCANCHHYKFDLDWSPEEKKIAAANDHIILADKDKRQTNRRCLLLCKAITPVDTCHLFTILVVK